MKLIMALAIASTLQLPPPVAASMPAILEPSVATVSEGSEVSIGPAGNPYRCVIWRVSDRKKYQKYCR